MDTQVPADSLAREMRPMTPRFEVLSETQRTILAPLCELTHSQSFYLGGGTAVALHLGHRRSLDFDWFRPTKIEDPLVLAQQARDGGLAIDRLQVAPGTMHAVIAGVPVSFFEYPYPLISPLTSLNEPFLQIASLDDLGCMKLAAVAQRGSRKDFIDLFAIALQHRPLEDLVHLYQRKYSTSDVAHILAGLAYFDDADDEPSPIMLWDVPWQDIRRQLAQWVKRLAG